MTGSGTNYIHDIKQKVVVNKKQSNSNYSYVSYGYCIVALICISTLMSGCSGGNVSDLEQYVGEVKSRKKTPIPALPEVQTYATYSYDEAKLRDPFAPTRKVIGPTKSNNGIKPPVNRAREILEQFPLDAMKMVGSLEQSGERWALIKTQDGTLYRAKRGNFLGQDYGEILRITESELVLQEVVPDGLGGWVKRQATLSVSE